MNYLLPQTAWPMLRDALGLPEHGVRSVKIVFETDSAVRIEIERFTESHELEKVLKVFEGAKLVDPPRKMAHANVMEWCQRFVAKDSGTKVEVKPGDAAEAVDPQSWRDREPLL